MLRQMNVLRRALFALNRQDRREAWHTVVGRLAKLLGTRVYDLHANWHDDPEFRALWDGTPWPAHAADARKYTLFKLVRALAGTEGDTAECGVYHGMSSHLILHETTGSVRLHHIFDSFDGLSEPTAPDAVIDPQVFRWRKHDLRAPEAIARRNLASFPSARFYPGWIPARFGEVADRTFALVHVDVDLYQPTLDSLTFFFPRLVPGGMIVCDDYGFASCPGARRAVDEYAAAHHLGAIGLPTGQALLVRPVMRVDV